MKNLSLIVYSAAIMLLSMPAMAQSSVTKEKAQALLLKTNRAIQVSQRAVVARKVYSGDLGKAVKNQRYARKLFKDGNYAKAVHFSKRARGFASAAMKANSAKPNLDFIITKEEEELGGSLPADLEMESELTKEQGETAIKDQDLIKSTNMDIDIK